MWYKIYLPVGDATTINVNQVCSADVGSPTVTYFVESLTDQEYDSATGSGNPGNAVFLGPKSSGPSCGTNPVQFNIPSWAGIPSTVLGHQAYRVFAFSAEITPIPGSNERYFRVAATDSNAYVGLASPEWAVGLKNQVYQYSTIYKPSGNNWSAEVEFAPACFQDTSNLPPIKIYDADNGIYQQNMHATMDASPGYPLNWSQVASWNAQTVQGGTWGASGTTGTLNYGNYKDNYVYKLKIIGSNYPNTIQIRLPFDQFDAKATEQNYCDVKCDNFVPQDQATIPVNQNFNVTIRGIGIKEPVNWVPDDTVGGYYIKRIGSNDINATGGVSEPNYVSLTGSNPYTDTVHPPPGTTQAIYTYEIYSRDPPLKSPFGTGITCKVTYNVAPIVTVTCTVGAQAGVAPGQTVNNLYTVNVKANGTGIGGNFSAQMSASPGAYVTGPNPNPQTVTIPNNPGSFSKIIYFSGHLDYTGTYNVTITDPGGSPATTCSGTSSPVVAPYFQVWQNDAAGGGAFKIGDSCPGAYSAYQNPYTANAAGQANAKYYGGIRANNNAYHSKTDFGAVALGLIPNPSGESFISPHNTLFANSGVTIGGGISGYFNSTGPSANHCATDFYSKTMINTPANTAKTNDLNSAVQNCLPNGNNERRCQYIWNGTDISGSQVSIPHGVQITVYVPSDINISTNIVYQQPYDPNIRADIPYFSLIVKGNITLTDGVTELDGLYIAQPTVVGSTASGGIFNTCDSQCPHQLIVNGAVIAQHVELLRAHGSSQSLGTDINGIGNAPAEIFNFVPSMVLGAPAFSPQSPTPEGLFSLPPVF
ncbi:MAG TPA: hypothetical protein VFH37_02990 [Candidatus Saccharimonadales bacterium]|nr:hypothetical protein [Candidatus Saccharimonadales bacterium]